MHAVIPLLCKMESLCLPEDIDYDDGEVKTNSLILIWPVPVFPNAPQCWLDSVDWITSSNVSTCRNTRDVNDLGIGRNDYFEYCTAQVEPHGLTCVPLPGLRFFSLYTVTAPSLSPTRTQSVSVVKSRAVGFTPGLVMLTTVGSKLLKNVVHCELLDRKHWAMMLK